MLKYIVRRILIFIPTLLVISLIMFAISMHAPGDPVRAILDKQQGESGQGNVQGDETAYLTLRHKLGLDLPAFYFSFGTAASCDTLYRIPQTDVRDNLARLTFTYGNWTDVSAYYTSIKKAESGLSAIKPDSANANALIAAKNDMQQLYTEYEPDKINAVFSKLDADAGKELQIGTMLAAVRSADKAMMDNQSSFSKYIPVFHWYGFRNQYHHWLVSFLRGDLGVSYQDMRPVSAIVWDAMKWTIGISFLSVLLAYFIAIPLGVGAAVGKGTRKEKLTTTGLFMLYSLPNFWIATLLIIFFCGGDWFSWFPAPGAPPILSDASFMQHLIQGLYRLILPLICWTYTSLAFISRQMRGGMLSALGQDYVRTARAKGLPENTVIWKHALRNSLLPIITLFANVFPLLLSGSVVIEQIFSIPGMGQVSYNALLANDYPVIFATAMVAAILTLLGTLIADILYAVADPRISYSKSVA